VVTYKELDIRKFYQINDITFSFNKQFFRSFERAFHKLFNDVKKLPYTSKVMKPLMTLGTFCNRPLAPPPPVQRQALPILKAQLQ